MNKSVKKAENAVVAASLTVEASYVMAIVIVALAVLIRTAYSQCARTTDVMKLHWRVEQLRCQEEDQEKAIERGQVTRESGRVEGYIKCAGWEKEISAGAHEPEEALRLITIFGPDD